MKRIDCAVLFAFIWGIASWQSVRALDLPAVPADGLVKTALVSDDPKDKAAFLKSFLGELVVAYGEDDPPLQLLIERLVERVKRDPKSGTAVLNVKYYTWYAERWATVEAARAGLKGRPDAYRKAWLAWLAPRAIGYRIPYDAVALGQRMADLPPGEVVAVADAEQLRKELTVRYGWTAADAGTLMTLVEVNPTLALDGRYAGDGKNEARLHAVSELAGRKWVYPVALSKDAAVLMPEAAWMKERAAGWKPETTGMVTRPRIRYLWMLCEGLGFAGGDAVLRVDLDEGATPPRVTGALLFQPDMHNRPIPVFPRDPTPEKHPAVSAGRSGSDDPDEAPVKAPAATKAAEVADEAPPSLDEMVSPVPPSMSAPPAVKAVSGAPKERGRLVFKDGVLGGVGVLSIAPPKGGGMNAVLELDVRIDGEQANGVYKRWLAEVNGNYQVSTGRVTKGAPLPTGDPVTESWPSLFGPNHDWAVPCGEPMVADFEEARLQWVSDVLIPTGRGPDVRGCATRIPEGRVPMGGWASPLVNGGLVLLPYYIPTGPYGMGVKPHDDPIEDECWRINRCLADDVLHAFDAASGRTAWIAVMPDTGINWSSMNKGGPMSSPALADGRMVTLGTAGRVFCHDAANGALVWENNLGMRFELMQEFRRIYAAEGSAHGSRSDFQSAIVIVDGIAVLCDHRMTKRDYRYEVGNSLIGFDLRTGRRLWSTLEFSSTRFMGGPQILRLGNRDYLVTNTRDAKGTTVLDPRTGKNVVSIPGMYNNHAGFALGEGLIVGDRAEAAGDGKPAGSIMAWRIDADLKPTEAWSLPQKYAGRGGGGVVQGGRVYLQMNKPVSGLYCVDAASGQVLAEAPCPVPDAGEHCPYTIKVGDRLIGSGDQASGLFWLDADPAKMAGSVDYWPARLASGYCGAAMPALAGGRLFIRGTERMLCYDLRQSQSPKRARSDLWGLVTHGPTPEASPATPAPVAAPAPDANRVKPAVTVRPSPPSPPPTSPPSKPGPASDPNKDIPSLDDVGRTIDLR
jgi:outer membrane protein assembly factor BamB